MKINHLTIIAKKEFRGLLNEKTILLAILLLVQSNAKNTQLSRYTETLAPSSPMGDFKTLSQFITPTAV